MRARRISKPWIPKPTKISTLTVSRPETLNQRTRSPVRCPVPVPASFRKVSRNLRLHSRGHGLHFSACLHAARSTSRVSHGAQRRWLNALVRLCGFHFSGSIPSLTSSSFSDAESGLFNLEYRFSISDLCPCIYATLSAIAAFLSASLSILSFVLFSKAPSAPQSRFNSRWSSLVMYILPNNVISLNSVEVYAQWSRATRNKQGNCLFRIWLMHMGLGEGLTPERSGLRF